MNLGVMIATLANDIAPVSKPISEFVEKMVGTGGRKQFASPTEVADAAEALDRKLFSPARVVRSTISPIRPKRFGLMTVVALGLLAVATIAVAAWLWWRAHQPH